MKLSIIYRPISCIRSFSAISVNVCCSLLSRLMPPFSIFSSSVFDLNWNIGELLFARQSTHSDTGFPNQREGIRIFFIICLRKQGILLMLTKAYSPVFIIQGHYHVALSRYWLISKIFRSTVNHPFSHELRTIHLV